MIKNRQDTRTDLIISIFIINPMGWSSGSINQWTRSFRLITSTFFLELIDPRGRLTVTWCLYVRQFVISQKQNNFKWEKWSLLVGLAEWIIDGTQVLLVLSFTHLNSPCMRKWETSFEACTNYHTIFISISYECAQFSKTHFHNSALIEIDFLA